MSMRAFIRQNRAEIDRLIKLTMGECAVRLNDRERELWIRNDYGLYLWATAEGVRV